jgi:hypothetical protein
MLPATQQQQQQRQQPPFQHETSRGQLVNLLRVAAEPSVDLGVRQVACITFKQTAKRHWEPEREGECAEVVWWSVLR